jgi:uncharacterized protein involved in exopolysaccharide biosynthesis
MACLSFTWTEMFQSDARILPGWDSRQNALGQVSATASLLGLSLPNQEGGEANFVDILESRGIKEKVLTAHYRFHYKKWKFGRNQEVSSTLYDFLKAKNMDQAVRRLASVYSANRDFRSKVITVSVITASPELSQQICQTILTSLEFFVTQKNRTRGGNKAAFLSGRLEEAKRDYADSESKLKRFLAANQNYRTTEDPSIRLDGARLEGELLLRKQLITTLSLSQEQALMDEKNDLPLINILDSPNLPIDRSAPSRGRAVELTLALTGLASMLWFNRRFLAALLLASNRLPPTGV